MEGAPVCQQRIEGFGHGWCWSAEAAQLTLSLTLSIVGPLLFKDHRFAPCNVGISSEHPKFLVCRQICTPLGYVGAASFVFCSRRKWFGCVTEAL
jgi:hypothetical protein